MENLIFSLAITEVQANAIVSPVMDMIRVFLPVLLTLVATVGFIWCIVLGVKFAKSSDPQEHQQAKKALINAILGFVLIFILMLVLNIAFPFFLEMVKDVANFHS